MAESTVLYTYNRFLPKSYVQLSYVKSTFWGGHLLSLLKVMGMSIVTVILMYCGFCAMLICTMVDSHPALSRPHVVAHINLEPLSFNFLRAWHFNSLKAMSL